MSIAWSDVTAIAPELSTAAAATQTAILTMVDLMVDDAAWGDLANQGRAYLAAHIGTVSGSGSGAGAGAVTSETIGPFSREYADTGADDGSLSTTKYGRFYKYLMRTALAISAVVP
jgi:hypothetical protein